MTVFKNIKAKWKLVTVLSCIFIIALTILLAIVLFKVKTIEVIGNDRVQKEEIINNYITGPLGDNMFVIKIKDKFEAFNPMPFIRDYDISYEGNNKITIQVYEKKLVAGFEYMGEYIYFDKDGLILETSFEPLDNTALIEGVNFSTFAINDTINVENDDQIRMILDISELIKHYEMDIKKIRFDENYEVTLVASGVRVFLGKQKMYDEQFAALVDVLKKAKKNKLKGTIDMRNYNRGDKIILKLRSK